MSNPLIRNWATSDDVILHSHQAKEALCRSLGRRCKATPRRLNRVCVYLRPRAAKPRAQRPSCSLVQPRKRNQRPIVCVLKRRNDCTLKRNRCAPSKPWKMRLRTPWKLVHTEPRPKAFSFWAPEFGLIFIGILPEYVEDDSSNFQPILCCLVPGIESHILAPKECVSLPL